MHGISCHTTTKPANVTLYIMDSAEEEDASDLMPPTTNPANATLYIIDIAEEEVAEIVECFNSRCRS